MIITRSPLRITLGGGGTDLPSYYRERGGFLIAAAIDKYVYVTVIRPFTPGIYLKYSKLEHVESVAHLPVAIADALQVDQVRILRAGGDAAAAEREQWSDGNNYFALAPGVVVGYDRNVATNGMLEANGIEVIAVSGGELGRGGDDGALSRRLDDLAHALEVRVDRRPREA